MIWNAPRSMSISVAGLPGRVDFALAELDHEALDDQFGDRSEIVTG